MDVNLVLIKGKPLSEPVLVTFPDGVSFMRFMVGVRVDCPEDRLDLLPVIWWQPRQWAIDSPPPKGRTVWIIGAVRRRFLDVADPPRSDVEIVATDVILDPQEAALIE